MRFRRTVGIRMAVVAAIAIPFGATIVGVYRGSVVPDQPEILSCWLLPPASVPHGGALDALCPLEPYERITAVDTKVGRQAVRRRADLDIAIQEGSPRLRATATRGERSRQVEIPILREAYELRVSQFAVGAALGMLFAVFGLTLSFRTERAEAMPLALICGLLSVYILTALSRSQGSLLDATRLFAQTLLPATLFHLALVFPRERHTATQTPLVPFLYLWAIGLFVVELTMASWNNVLWEIADRVGGIFTLAACTALGISGYLALQESHSASERTAARLLVGAAVLSLACVAVLSLGIGSSLPVAPRRTLTVGAILLLALLTHLVSRFGIRDVPLAVRWALSYVLYASVVASLLYAAWFAADGHLDLHPNAVDPAVFLGLVFLGLVVIDRSRRASWGIVERWVTPWAPRLNRLRTEYGRAAPAWEDPDDAAIALVDTVAEGIDPTRVAAYLPVGGGGWRAAGARGGPLFSAPVRDDGAALLKNAIGRLPERVLHLEQLQGPFGAEYLRLRSAGVEVVAGLVVGDEVLGFVLIGPLSRSRLISSDHLSFLEGVCGQTALAIKNMQLQDHVIDSARMAALGRAAVELGHDLRRPVGEIYLEAETLESAAGAAHESGEAIRARALECLEHLEGFVARGKRAHDAREELGDVLFAVDGAVSRIQGLFGRRPVVRVTSPRLAAVQDVRSVQRVLENLLENACHATASDDLIEVAIQGDALQIELRVVDSGCGMDEALLARAFEPFCSGRGGTGLGLAVCRDIVEALGGRIVASSAPGEGTEVRVSLPGVDNAV